MSRLPFYGEGPTPFYCGELFHCLYFESINPRFNAYVDLKNSKLQNYSKANRNKVRNSRRKGLYIEKGTMQDLESYYKLEKRTEHFSHYRNLFTIFGDTFCSFG